MRDIKEVVVDGELLFLKKSKIFGWGIVYPYRIDGEINWKNVLIGGLWIRFGMMVGIIILLILASFEYSNTVEMLNQCLNEGPILLIR